MGKSVRWWLVVWAHVALAMPQTALAAPGPDFAPEDWVHLPPRTVGETPISPQLRPEVPGATLDPATWWLRGRLNQPRFVAGGQPGDLKLVHRGGAASHAVDLLIVADGFTKDQRKDFADAVAKTTESLLSSSPYGEYAALFNVFSLFVASAEAGGSHPSQDLWVDNAFGTTFDYGGIARLAVADNAAVTVAAKKALPGFDLAVVLVNDAAYGGSGGPVPVVSVAPESVLILLHELAHNLANLADEYESPYPGYPKGDSEPNVASAAHLDPLKWSAWVQEGTPIPTDLENAIDSYTPIGAYEGARYQTTGMFRPAPNCIMRSLDAAFCPVCTQALILSLHARTQILRGQSPPTKEEVSCTVGSCPTFAVNAAPIDTVEVRWLRDDQTVGKDVTWTPGPADTGDYSLVARVEDLTVAVRTDPKGALGEQVTWTLHVTPGAATGDDAGQGDAGLVEDSGEGEEPAPVEEPARDSGGCTAGQTGGAGAAGAWPMLALTIAWMTRRRREGRKAASRLGG